MKVWKFSIFRVPPNHVPGRSSEVRHRCLPKRGTYADMTGRSDGTRPTAQRWVFLSDRRRFAVNGKDIERLGTPPGAGISESMCRTYASTGISRREKLPPTGMDSRLACAGKARQL